MALAEAGNEYRRPFGLSSVTRSGLVGLPVFFRFAFGLPRIVSSQPMGSSDYLLLRRRFLLPADFRLTNCPLLFLAGVRFAMVIASFWVLFRAE